MIDLHSHTTNSDGTWSTKELLEKAQSLNLEAFSITDHDTAKSYIEMEQNDELKNIYKGKLIIGAELNCTFNGVKIEVLAYDFDLHSVQSWLEDYYSEERNKNRLIDEFKDLVKICNEQDIKIENNLKYNPEIEYPVDVIYDSIIKFPQNKKFFTNEQWNDCGVFFRTCTVDKNFPLYRDFTNQMPTLEFIKELIHKYNGKIFLAHLYKYNLSNHINFLNKIIDETLIDGIEVYHSSFSQEQIDTLHNYCKDKKLLMSGGSDCHGDKKKDRKLGIGYGNLNIDKKIIEDWNLN